ncbi:hypothetical protein GCM10011352_37350 [Marinobacterium zhoushanense]|uniref:AMP-dependent synthetase/ligase domain-containing protein n=1 Tax=Marinobacterium zhoushanense TaxID=1679163 RepID=A0ABQ1KQJ3_9GAMM|nr:AMP-binding protein [Marinobacterium zhoushanense]GGC07614.1 hypothetical protein GCM10011352_37350 [Marinobacterium zhoushanense]
MTLFDRWQCWSERLAVLTSEGESLTYSQLAECADSFFPQVAANKELLLLVADNSLQSLIAYIAALRTGRAVMLQPASISAQQLQALVEIYQPEWLYDPRNLGVLDRLSTQSQALYSELAVLLSTSGSTGSPKHVRLSCGNIYSNAAAIAEYLTLGAADRPLAHLPLSYSYGLSVVNSHLLVGATLLLTRDSMMERRFWQFCKEQGATSLAGVPYHYDMMERLRFQRMDLPALRTLTQAGGRMPKDKVLHWATWSRQQGKKFLSMYGQTEATARISYMPAELILEYPEGIGVAIPGGQLSLIDEQGETVTVPDTAGELVYEGPNVMLGYARSRADLKRGAEVSRLHTGDLACVNGKGIYYIVGRLRRFIKLFGLRINLDEVEQSLRMDFGTVACVGRDQSLTVAYVGQEELEGQIKKRLMERYGFHPGVIRVISLEALPLTDSGKIDYRLLADHCDKLSVQECL